MTKIKEENSQKFLLVLSCLWNKRGNNGVGKKYGERSRACHRSIFKSKTANFFVKMLLENSRKYFATFFSRKNQYLLAYEEGLLRRFSALGLKVKEFSTHSFLIFTLRFCDCYHFSLFCGFSNFWISCCARDRAIKKSILRKNPE